MEKKKSMKGDARLAEAFEKFNKMLASDPTLPARDFCAVENINYVRFCNYVNHCLNLRFRSIRKRAADSANGQLALFQTETEAPSRTNAPAFRKRREKFVDDEMRKISDDFLATMVETNDPMMKFDAFCSLRGYDYWHWLSWRKWRRQPSIADMHKIAAKKIAEAAGRKKTTAVKAEEIPEALKKPAPSEVPSASARRGASETPLKVIEDALGSEILNNVKLTVTGPSGVRIDVSIAGGTPKGIEETVKGLMSLDAVQNAAAR